MLVEQLPDEAALSRAQHPPPFVDPEWTLLAELLAQLVEITSASAAGRRLREPVRIPRPEQRAEPARPREQRRRSSPDELAAFFGPHLSVVPDPPASESA